MKTIEQRVFELEQRVGLAEKNVIAAQQENARLRNKVRLLEYRVPTRAVHEATEGAA